MLPPPDEDHTRAGASRGSARPPRAFPQEEERIAGELEAILGYVDKLNELDVTNVEPTSHVFDVGAAFREDEVRNEPAVDELLENAPDRWQGFFRVPKIIE